MEFYEGYSLVIGCLQGDIWTFTGCDIYLCGYFQGYFTIVLPVSIFKWPKVQIDHRVIKIDRVSGSSEFTELLKIKPKRLQNMATFI